MKLCVIFLPTGVRLPLHLQPDFGGVKRECDKVGDASGCSCSQQLDYDPWLVLLAITEKVCSLTVQNFEWLEIGQNSEGKTTLGASPLIIKQLARTLLYLLRLGEFSN